MSRYDRSYDFGMRGYRQTTRPLGMGRGRRFSYDRPYDLSYTGGERGYLPLPNRVTARYNRDYVDGQRGYDRPYGFQGGDRPDRMGDETFYRRPYSTIGGTRTMRGADGPRGFIPGRFGPGYGGRYPDEL
jgi:hypothetical protein